MGGAPGQPLLSYVSEDARQGRRRSSTHLMAAMAAYGTLTFPKAEFNLPHPFGGNVQFVPKLLQARRVLTKPTRFKHEALPFVQHVEGGPKSLRLPDPFVFIGNNGLGIRRLIDQHCLPFALAVLADSRIERQVAAEPAIHRDTSRTGTASSSATALATSGVSPSLSPLHLRIARLRPKNSLRCATVVPILTRERERKCNRG